MQQRFEQIYRQKALEGMGYGGIALGEGKKGVKYECVKQKKRPATKRYPNGYKRCSNYEELKVKVKKAKAKLAKAKSPKKVAKRTAKLSKLKAKKKASKPKKIAEAKKEVEKVVKALKNEEHKLLKEGLQEVEPYYNEHYGEGISLGGVRKGSHYKCEEQKYHKPSKKHPKYPKGYNRCDDFEEVKKVRKPRGQRGPKRENPWVDFLFKYAKKHGLTYGEAMGDKKASKEYKKMK